MGFLQIFVIGIIGSAVGSFLNSAVYRLRIREFKSIFLGRSFCPNCKKSLRARDLIPLVSFFLLGRKCQFCTQKISTHYFWVELITASIFGLIAWQMGFGQNSLLLWHLLFATVLIFLASFDFQFGEIPDEVSLPATLFAFLGSFFIFTISPAESLVGLLIGGGFFTAIVLASNGKWMGGGDIRMGLLLGALLGWQGFLIALFIASFSGSIVGIAQVIQKKKKLKSTLPFAPFLAMGGIIALLFSEKIWEYYAQLFI